MEFIKAHAYGNDFLFVAESETHGRDAAALARTLCERHTGVGADGLVLYRPTSAGAAMRLLNADGSHAEVSGNGVRCLAALVINARRVGEDADTRQVEPITIETDSGPKVLRLLGVEHGTYTFRAWMGQPSELREIDLDAAGARVRVAALRVGNPQCVVLGPRISDVRFRELGPALERHPAFPAGTNVEFAEVMSAGSVRILIWERGVGATAASGTGACAAAVVAAEFGGASRDVEVVSPGGTQRVEWLSDGLYLTGSALIAFRGEWVG
jgi:diaminopimelate epimerase